MKNDPSQLTFEEVQPEADNGPVVCLGMTFKNDEERREYFREELRKKLPELKKMEGFPKGNDEDIIALSDPPYYTACPNPWLNDFIEQNKEKEEDESTLQKKPYTGDLKSTKRHPVYSYHPYHTKVPPEIIKELIEHYSNPGDVVLDGFSGTGMTGVAAREAGRNAIVGDLSPIATFVSHINTTSFDVNKAIDTLKAIIKESEEKWGHLYITEEDGKKVRVNYYVWCDVFTCPECVYEFPFFPTGVEHFGNKVKTKKQFHCPSCGLELNVRKINRVLTHEGKKKALVWVNAGTGKNRINREPNEFDFNLKEEIEEMKIPYWYPVDEIDKDGYTAKLAQLGDKMIDNVSKMLSKRNLIVFSDLWSRVLEIKDASIRHLCQSVLTSIFTVISERQGYFGGGGGMSGNLYMPIVRMERNIYDSLNRKIGRLLKAEEQKQGLQTDCFVTTQSTTALSQIEDNSIDYIYTDPPFGSNIIYSEMNNILESWLRVKMNDEPEAVINEPAEKNEQDYGKLMLEAFKEYYRILKPNRWITVEFHNTQASIWNLIQNALGKSGFVITQVSLLDKGSTTLLADIRPRAAVQDLIISAYKPSERVLNELSDVNSTEQVWYFIEEYLERLPVFISNGNEAVFISERSPKILYDRMLAFCVQNNYPVQISSVDFHTEIEKRYIIRDGMVFLEHQIAEYENARLEFKEFGQLELFVTDESSAIKWLQSTLQKQPQTRKDIHPEFLKVIQNIDTHEQLPELDELLEQNFLKYEGDGPVPEQILNYLRKKDKSLEDVEADNPLVVEKALHHWYVPDPNKQADLERLREKALLREFEGYLEELANSRKKLKNFRTEAIRAGFKKAYSEKDFETIVKVGERISEKVLQEDDKLLMYYDNACIRLGL